MVSSSWALLLALFFSTVVLSAAEEEERLKILALGGNGMIGAETLSRLIEDGNYDITLASRGNWEFDSDERIQPYVTHVECDRSEPLEEACPELLEDIEDTEQYYAVIDFSGYEPEWVRNTAEVLDASKVRVYIYVSSDSIYEVSVGEPYSVTGKKTLETDSVRPEDPEVREELNKLDEYGDKKFAAEEVLLEYNDKFPHVFLRFSDVIGPRDNTARYTGYHLWLRYQDIEAVPAIHVPEDIVETTSVTYVDDAADSIIAAMDTPDSWNEAYNIACDEIFNITSALITMAEAMDIEDVVPTKEEEFYLLPSAVRGPVDISKAREKLGFEPTPLEDALEATVEWYEEEMTGENLEILLPALHEWAESLFANEEDAEVALDEILTNLAYEDEL